MSKDEASRVAGVADVDALPSAAHFLTQPGSRFLSRLASPGLLVERDPYPLPKPKQRVGYYGERHLDYWISGLEDFRAILQTIDRHGGSLVPGDNILDFGCSSGRVLRHFFSQFPAEGGGVIRCQGVDVQQAPIEWMVRHLSPDLHVQQTHTEPPLPLADRSAALVYAFSVFTHIDEHELAWIAELRRILRPGGIAYLSVHTERTWDLIGRDTHWPLHGFLTRDGMDEQGRAISAEDLRAPMPRDRICHLSESSDVPRIFQSQEYLQREWGSILDILEIIETGSAYHDIVVLRREP